MGRLKNVTIHTGKYKVLLYHNDKGRILRLLLSELHEDFHPTLFRMIVFFGSSNSSIINGDVAKKLNSNMDNLILIDDTIHMCLVRFFSDVVGGKTTPLSDNSH